MFNPGDLSKLFNQFFSREEQEKIVELGNKSFDEKMDGLADIFEKNARIPAGQGKIMAKALRDKEIRQDMKEIEDSIMSGGLSQAELMQKSIRITMKIQQKFGR